MKKSVLVVILAALMTIVTVSCSSSSNIIQANNELATVAFSQVDSKSLDVVVEGDQSVSSMYWYYTAVKTDSGNKTGATGSEHSIADAQPVILSGTKSVSGGKGLDGNVLATSFAVGNWTFRLYGYTSKDRAEGTLVYTSPWTDASTEGTSANLKSMSLNNVSVSVDPVKESGTGVIVISNITAPKGSVDPELVYKVSGVNNDWQPMNGNSAEIASLATGSYLVTIGAVYDKGQEPLLTTSIRAQVYSGYTTTVSGSIDDLTGGVEFDIN